MASSNAINDVNITLTSLVHTWDSDLDIYLRSPVNTQVELSTDNGGMGNDYTNTIFDDEAVTAITAGTAPFTGSFRPEGLLSGFDGQAGNGTWQLEVYDDADGDTGTLNGWSLTITPIVYTCVPYTAGNNPPVLDLIGNQSGNELTLISFTATATDPDPGDTLTFSLDAGAPAGAAITTGGSFTWTPTEAQGPGVYTVTVRVTDNGSPALDDFETIQITVNEVNTAPVLAAIGNQSGQRAGSDQLHRHRHRRRPARQHPHLHPGCGRAGWRSHHHRRRLHLDADRSPRAGRLHRHRARHRQRLACPGRLRDHPDHRQRSQHRPGAGSHRQPERSTS